MTRAKAYKALSAGIYISLFFGLFPMYVGESKDGLKIAKSNKYFTLIIFIYLSAYTIGIYLGSQQKNTIIEEDVYSFNIVAKLILIILVFLGIATTYIFYICSYIYKNTIKELINLIPLIDRNLTCIGNKFHYSRFFCLNFTLIINGILFIFFILVIEIWNIPRENLRRIPPTILFVYAFPSVILHLGETQFVLFMAFLYMRFKAINKSLKELDKKLVKEKTLTMSKQNKVNVIILKPEIYNAKNEENIVNCCIRVYDKLCDMGEDLNKIFAWVIIAGSLIQLWTITFTFCYIYYNVSSLIF